MAFSTVSALKSQLGLSWELCHCLCILKYSISLNLSFLVQQMCVPTWPAWSLGTEETGPNALWGSDRGPVEHGAGSGTVVCGNWSGHVFTFLSCLRWLVVGTSGNASPSPNALSVLASFKCQLHISQNYLGRGNLTGENAPPCWPIGKPVVQFLA